MHSFQLLLSRSKLRRYIEGESGAAPLLDTMSGRSPRRISAASDGRMSTVSDDDEDEEETLVGFRRCRLA